MRSERGSFPSLFKIIIIFLLSIVRGRPEENVINLFCGIRLKRKMSYICGGVY